MLAQAAPLPGYSQTNLVSNINGLAANTDANLQNPWGIAFSGSSPFWVTDNAHGTATLYDSAGAPQSLVVTIPKVGGGTSAPTGTAFNGTSAFNGDSFLFATEDGLITGWRGALGTNAETLSITGTSAVYKGLTVATVSGHTYAYAADFHNGTVFILKGDSAAPNLTGNFTDPNLPAGFAPFNIQNLGGKMYVTYAKQAANGIDEQPGAGQGFVSIFDTNGNLLQHLVGSGGALNAPWGLAVAPDGFGLPAGDVLVGNLGDGKINVYDPAGTFVGTLADASSTPIVNSGLWGITFGNGTSGGSPTSLYLAAGINNQADGLIARIDLPEPGVLSVVCLSASIGMLRRSRRR
jgi:uncharacterized protein (TIGR03118 family)